MKKTVEITVFPNGESRIETKGFSGADCRTASRFLECSLGTTRSETLTASFHERRIAQDNEVDQET